MMKFIDAFDTPNTAWLRGAVTASQKTDWPVIGKWDDQNHVTLSGLHVNPACFGEFSILLRFTFPEEEQGYALFGFGKPHEWSTIAESRVQIKITRDGTMTILGPDGSVLFEGALPRNAEGGFEFRVKKSGDSFEIRWPGSETTIAFPGGLDTAGFFTIRTEETPLRLCAFEMESPIEAQPLSAQDRQADIAAWKRWRMDENYRNQEELREYVRQSVENHQWGFDTDMSISPRLVHTGEAFTVTFRSKNKPADSTATLEHDYLGPRSGTVQNLALDWTTDETGWFVAEAEIVADVPGNSRVVWKVNGERLVRVIGVIEQGYTVCLLWVGSNEPPIDREIHRFDLPAEHWVGYWRTPFDKPPEMILKDTKHAATFRHLYGEVLVPFANAGWLFPDIPNVNLFEIDKALQEEGLAMIRNFMDTLQLGPMELLATYTMGHKTPAAAAKVGLKGVTSMCVWQNWLDGGEDNCWKINHWGAPIVPYYMADDDFRKVAPGKGTMSFNMGTATDVRNYTMGGLEGCASNADPLRIYNVANLHRFHYALQGWLHDAANNTQPLFITVALENFSGREDWRQANELAVEYLVQRAKKEKLVFTTSAGTADYYGNHYDVQPENVFYQPDIYCGLRIDLKPAALPDRIEFSNHLCHSLHADGQPLPQIMWDYTAAWQNKEWQDDRDLRSAGGLILPETSIEHSCTPKNVDLKGVAVDIETTNSAKNSLQVKVTLDLPSPLRYLSIALWRLPFAPEDVRVGCDLENVSWRSVVDGFTGNLNGLILFDSLPKGRTVATLTFEGTAVQPRRREFMIGDSICAREVILDRQPCVYLWRADGAKEQTLELTLPDNKAIYALSVDGQKITPDETGRIRIPFTDQRQQEVYLLYGVTREMI